MMLRRNRWIRSLVVGLAFGALTVPAAQARVVEEGSVPVGGPGVGATDPGVPAAPQTAVPAAVGGFDWGDAGIGAGAAGALGLLGLGTRLATRRVGRGALARA